MKILQNINLNCLFCLIFSIFCVNVHSHFALYRLQSTDCIVIRERYARPTKRISICRRKRRRRQRNKNCARIFSSTQAIYFTLESFSFQILRICFSFFTFLVSVLCILRLSGISNLVLNSRFSFCYYFIHFVLLGVCMSCARARVFCLFVLCASLRAAHSANKIIMMLLSAQTQQKTN